MNNRGTGADYREKSAWASLMTTGLVYAVVLTSIAAAPESLFGTVGVLIVGVVMQTLAMIVLHIVFAMGTPEEPDDERDLLIQMRSGRAAGWILSIAVVCAIGALLVQQFVLDVTGKPVAELDVIANPIAVSHLLLFSLVIAEMTRHASVVVAYRRGE